MTTITVYQTDADGAYIHEIQAHELPLDPGVFNVPFGASLVAPPETDDDHVPVAVNGNGWTVKADHRRNTLYRIDNDRPYAFGTVIDLNGQPVRYSGLGDIPDWLTEMAPAVPEPMPPEPDADD